LDDAQLPVLAIEIFHSCPLSSRQPGALAGVDRSLKDPDPQRLMVDVELSTIKQIVFQCDGYSCWCSKTIRIARSRKSGAYLPPVPTRDIALSSQRVDYSPD